MKYDFSYYISKFFTDYLIKQRNASMHTISSYRDTFSLLLRFYTEGKKGKIEKMDIAVVNKKLITDFLNWLETERESSVATQNQRLAAVHAFFRFVQMEEPQYLVTAQNVLSISFRKVPRPVINYLSTEGIRVILTQPKQENKLGYRDFVLLTAMYDTGARVQEVADLTLGDIVLSKPPHIILTGKGRKSRVVPLMQETSEILSRYISSYPFTDTRKLTPLFRNRMDQKLTRAGISYILEKYVKLARQESPDEIPDVITPHCIRHSKAMHLLQAGVNLVYIRDFLGHNDIKTTEVYARADSKAKRKALENAYENLSPSDSKGSWKDDKGLMSWLKNL